MALSWSMVVCYDATLVLLLIVINPFLKPEKMLTPPYLYDRTVK
jgi:hypothetical protein